MLVLLHDDHEVRRPGVRGPAGPGQHPPGGSRYFPRVLHVTIAFGLSSDFPQTPCSSLREMGSAPDRDRHSTILLPRNASVQWLPDGLAIHTNKCFLEAGFLAAPPISIILPRRRPTARRSSPASARTTPFLAGPKRPPSRPLRVQPPIRTPSQTEIRVALLV